MAMKTLSFPLCRTAGRTLAGLALLALAGAQRTLADDRDMLRSTVGQPYVFIMLDTSGSMNWAPPCSQADFNAGKCSFLCPAGDCYVPLQGDDSASKLYQAKQALYDVLQDVNGVHFGFATYNQDGLSARAKHWLYQAAGNGVSIPGWGFFPAAGAQDVFGYLWSCDTGSNDNEIGCVSATPADLNDSWELARMQRLAKGGINFNQNVDFYVRTPAAVVYKVRYQPISGTYGATVQVSVIVSKCTNSGCTSTSAVGTQTVAFNAVGDFLSWDNADSLTPQRTNPEITYFGQSYAADANASNTCSGWDPNTDTTNDQFNGYSARFPTDSSDSRGTLFSIGDVVPLDWKVYHETELVNRFAPNLVLTPAAAPDFRIAAYFNDKPQGSDAFLRLKNESARPLVASGSTPLGATLRSFRAWWAGCASGTCTPGTGWKSIAAAQDANWACRKKFLIVITDGDETCNGDPCSAATTLFSVDGVKVYVIGFGVDSSVGNKLTCMAKNGGSGAPVYPQNKTDLEKALADIFGEIQEEAKTFASAAVPSVQAEASDRLYLSSFVPLNGQSVWDGHIDAYLKPLPLTADGKPDRNRACPAAGGSTLRSSCHLWDAGTMLVAQAPAQSDLDAAPVLDETALRLGLGTNQRRVFYAKENTTTAIPTAMRLLSPPTGAVATDPDWTDLFKGLQLSTASANLTASQSEAKLVIKQTLAIKSATVDLPGAPATTINYVLGDIFHSNPIVLDQPTDFNSYANDLHGTAGATSCTGNQGYRCFADKQIRRRKMLAVGSDDGQLHFFDAGIWDPTAQKFADGTGTELFSYIPRLALPIVRQLVDGGKQVFGLDGTARVVDVFLDPSHNGTPTAADREWRTVLMGGFREGGSIDDGGGRMSNFVSGYYALDVTQPDKLGSDNQPLNQQVVPSCLTTTNGTVSGCGTLAFPSVLWEFIDALGGSQLNEDQPSGNALPDLGQTWSVPTLGRIRVIENGVQTEKTVAIFGGGMDADSKANPQRGNWLYMVDVETGQTLYKHKLVGAVPSDPAVVDTDLDGFLDTIYIGTTAGLLYKMDIHSAAAIQQVTIPKTSTIPNLAANTTVKRITDPAWDPFPIFDTLGKPIYSAPTVFFVAKLERYALAFGTGDRENLWDFTGLEGRFYLIVDDNYTAAQTATGVLPRTENSYQQILAGSADAAAGADFVLKPATGLQRGWYLRLDANERVITQAFGLAGIVTFSSYQPQVTVSGGTADPTCAHSGDSHIFVIYAGSANSVMTVDGTNIRWRSVPEFVTNPFVEQGATKNPTNAATGINSEQLDQTQQNVLAALRSFFPKGTRFANYWVSVSGIRSDTGYERYATIPIGIVQKNWKEQ
jgi:Tfp pilus tip-associated adhesin PilY1